jgi:hypothetical protein
MGDTFLARATLLLTSVASSDAAQISDVDGGQNYYGEFSAFLPSDLTDFPNGVWFGAETRRRYRVSRRENGHEAYVGIHEELRTRLRTVRRPTAVGDRVLA